MKSWKSISRRLCVRIDGVPTVDNETSDEVLDKLKSLMKETSCDIPEIVIDRARRIGKGYNDKKTNVLKLLFCVLQPLGTEQC